MTANLHLWLIPLLPLLGAAINGAFGKRFSRQLVSAVGLAGSGAAFLYALWIASQYSALATAMPIVDKTLGTWIKAGTFQADFAFQLDQLSFVMLLIVTGVGFLIHVYSVGYMWEESGYYRFFCYLNLFLFFMLTLILAANYLLMFIGWEGVGLASYLLIGFYFTKDSAANAGKKAFIVNRIGDFGFLIALFLLIQHFGTLDFTLLADKIVPLGSEAGWGLLSSIGVLLMVGAAGKSAQIPLYVWLPDAMEGPTPVSALIHAATMVTAGVYMVSRSHVIFDRAPQALLVVAVIGCATAFFAATIGICQTDIKKVLAYSTVSQLGYMFLGCGAAAYSAGVFHLMTHAFFKGLLFLAAGSVIHSLGGEQDMRRMGGLRKEIPWTFWTMTAGTFAIAGFPFFAGYYSKDMILWKVSQHNPILFGFGLLTAFITSFYMFRLWFMTFFGERATAEAGHGHHDQAPAAHGHDDHGHDGHGHGHAGGHAHESGWLMLFPLVVLAILSVIGGWMVGGGEGFAKFLSPVFSVGLAADPTEVAGGMSEGFVSALATVAFLLGLGLAWFLYVRRKNIPAQIAQNLGGIYSAVLNKYWVDEIYATVIVNPMMAISRTVLWQGIDRKVIDATLDDAAAGANQLSGEVRKMQSGNIRSYAAWVAAGAVLVVGYMMWMGAAR